MLSLHRLEPSRTKSSLSSSSIPIRSISGVFRNLLTGVSRSKCQLYLVWISYISSWQHQCGPLYPRQIQGKFKANSNKSTWKKNRKGIAKESFSELSSSKEVACSDWKRVAAAALVAPNKIDRWGINRLVAVHFHVDLSDLCKNLCKNLCKKLFSFLRLAHNNVMLFLLSLFCHSRCTLYNLIKDSRVCHSWRILRMTQKNL